MFRRGGNSGCDSAHGSLGAKAPSPSMPEPVCFLDKSGLAGRRKMLNKAEFMETWLVTLQNSKYRKHPPIAI